MSSGKFGLLRQQLRVTRGEGERFVVTSQVVKVVSQIDRRVAVILQLRQHLVAQARRLGVLALVKENALTFAHHARVVEHAAGGAANPVGSDGNVSCLDGGVGRVGDHDRIVRCALECLLVGSVGAIKLHGGRVEVAQRKVRHIVIRIIRGQLIEVALGGGVVVFLPRDVAHRLQCIAIFRVGLQNLAYILVRFIASAWHARAGWHIAA